MAGSGDNLQSGEGNNSNPDVPLFGVVVGGVGGVVLLSVTVTVLSVACIYCCKRRHRQSGPLSVATSAAGSGVNNEDDVRLLTMRQRELTSPLPGSAPPPSSGFLHTSPLQTSNSAFITLDGSHYPRRAGRAL
ncbi:hypothetical protein GBAR_LOCUS14108 [Geodia barretti]|uniref:Uncharacterized protein n=1 Tax=Geodia barretti TaxID=519541 RepID=A0AA35WJZ2_GEOBA|nr:hypothetical protein GBAR_LOCUS14108 [Geodia barretti]